jgi:hypothetical protein
MQDEMPNTYTSMLCTAFNTTYNVSVNYTNGVSTFTTQLKHNAPLSDLNELESEGQIHNSTSAWHANSVILVREIFDNYLRGTWERAPTTQWASPNTSITDTILAGDTKDANDGTESSLWFVNQDLLTGVPQLLTNLTLSTIALSPLNKTTTCFAHTEQLVYYYNPKLLLIPYSIALLLCLIALTAGIWALWKSGVRTGEIFSQILVTTRNPFLDEIARGNSLSSAGAKELKDQKLKFGALKSLNDGETDHTDGEGTGHATFGAANQIGELTAKKFS